MIFEVRMRRNDDLEATIVAKFTTMAAVLDERARRLWAAAESTAIGYGGDALVSAATGLARETIRRGAARPIRSTATILATRNHGQVPSRADILFLLSKTCIQTSDNRFATLTVVV
jgi:hypothetical protein